MVVRNGDARSSAPRCSGAGRRDSGVGFAALSRMLGRNDGLSAAICHARHAARPGRATTGACSRRFSGSIRLCWAARPAPRLAPRSGGSMLAASAGPGALLEDDRAPGEMRDRSARARSLGLECAGCAAMLAARGDSMEPMIHDGDRCCSTSATARRRAPGSSCCGSTARCWSSASRGLGRASIDQRQSGLSADRRCGRCAMIGRVVWLSRALR